MLSNLDHVDFTVSDLEQSLAFYRDLLGLEVNWDMFTRKSSLFRMRLAFDRRGTQCGWRPEYAFIPGLG
jgi:catechol 2,3-dioxygenase-like lactoylglutathione lyase family enzyme